MWAADSQALFLTGLRMTGQNGMLLRWGEHKTCLKPDYAFKEVLCLVWASVSILGKKNIAVGPKQS